MEASCAICGRTILVGERVHEYFEGEAERTVCELCISRAEGLAWRQASEPAPERSGHRHEGRLRGLLHRRHRRPGAPVATLPQPAAANPAGSQRRALPTLDDSAPTPFERAAARFNSSEAGRAVVGLTRTLGSPRASVGASAGVPGEIRVTVAWELSWYQWGVDIGDELRPVFELGKGGEVGQLDAAARQWNAVVAADGKLRLAGERTPSR